MRQPTSVLTFFYIVLESAKCLYVSGKLLTFNATVHFFLVIGNYSAWPFSTAEVESSEAVLVR